MDEMKIKSKILTEILSRIISKSLKSKIGVDCKVKFNEIEFTNDGNNFCIKANIEGSMETSNVTKLIDKFLD